MGDAEAVVENEFQGWFENHCSSGEHILFMQEVSEQCCEFDL